MKLKLMALSLSPLFLLTIIINWGFETTSQSGIRYSFKDFLNVNVVLLLVDTICILWLILSFYFFLSFLAFKWSGTASGYTVNSVEEKKEASLNFFLTLIIPVLIDDVSTLQRAICFIIIVVLICVLLYKTDLYYANPVLAVLGYHFYEYDFEDNDTVSPGTYVGICKGEVSNQDSIEYKIIDKKNRVMYIKKR